MEVAERSLLLVDQVAAGGQLAAAGVLKVSALSDRTGVSRAGPILRDNHYGWFDRVKVGHYALSSDGQLGLKRWSHALPALSPWPIAGPTDAGPARHLIAGARQIATAPTRARRVILGA